MNYVSNVDTTKLPVVIIEIDNLKEQLHENSKNDL